MPAKLLYTGFLLTLLFCLSNCRFSEEPDEFSAAKINNTPLFYLSQFGTITDSPLNSPEIFNRKALMLLGIRKITIHSKGGKNPEDTLEKMTYSYNPDWQTLNFELKEFDENPVQWTKGKICLNRELNGKSEFSRYFGIDKNITSDFIRSGNNLLIIRNKPNNRKDTTTFYGSYDPPRAIVKRVGNKILSAELFVPAGSSSKEVRNAFASLGLDSTVLIFAECSVTFTENNKPTESYFLNENFSQVNLLKNWKYDREGKLAEYNEWSGSNLLKTILIHYSKGVVPDYFSINSKTFYIHYN